MAETGGLPPIIIRIIDCLSVGDLLSAKKLALAQQLISGVPDAGSWGGESMSDTEVRVRARNAECCNVLSSFLKYFDGIASPNRFEENERKVAILFGCYHIDDMISKFKTLGLRENPAVNSTKYTAWTVQAPGEFYADQNITRGVSTTTVLATLSFLVGYLLLGTLDWFLLFEFIIDTTIHVIGSLASTPSQLHSGTIYSGLQSLLGVNEAINDQAYIVALLTLYTVSYFQRHLGLLRAVSTVGVEWDRGLFDYDA
jgi:hypothetical protein